MGHCERTFKFLPHAISESILHVVRPAVGRNVARRLAAFVDFEDEARQETKENEAFKNVQGSWQAWLRR